MNYVSGYSVRVSLFVVGTLLSFFAVFTVAVRSAEAATTRFYVVGNTPNLPVSGPAGTTNLPIGNNSTLAATDGRYVTTLATAAPASGDITTNMQESYAVRRPAAPFYLLGTAYLNTGFATNATIVANASGSFNINTSNNSDKFRFRLIDYNPADGTVTVIGTSTSDPSASAGTISKRDVNFDNTSAYNLPAGHYLAVEVRYYPREANLTGYLYCNINKPSYVDVGIQFQISASTTVNGQVSALGTTTATSTNSPVITQFDYNSSKTYTASASDGYQINSVAIDGVPQPAATGLSSWSYNFGSIDRSHTISANFVGSTNTFTVQPGSGGHITVDCCAWIDWIGPGTYTYGLVTGTYVFTATPYAGFSVGEVYFNGIPQGVPGGQIAPYPVNLTLPASTSLAVDFIPFLDITTSVPGGGGSITPSSSSVPRGQSLIFEISADPGYRILSLTDNGVPVANPTASYTITNVQIAHNLVVNFQKTFTIAAVAGANGTISPIGDVIVDSGSNRNFSISPDFGYRVSGVLVDGTSLGDLSSYTFSGVTSDHTIEVSFVQAPPPSTYCAVPPYIASPAPPNVMLMLSVETPMQGPANPNVSCTGTPSALNFSCNTTTSSCSSNGSLGCYNNSQNYYGYFESYKCYTYAGSGASGLFSPSGAATNHQCGGTAWSGNFLNWMSTTAVDAFRKAFTGGNRAVDTSTDTVLLAARLDSNGWFPDTVHIENAELYTPYSGTRYFKREDVGIGYGICNAGQTNCTLTTSGSGEAEWPAAGSNTQAVFSLRIKACDATGGVESRCNSTSNKPEGTIQKYMSKMRFALMSYAADNNQNRDGGVLRQKMKWVGPKVPYGLMYHTSATATATCNLTADCDNPEKEVNSDGTFVNNPDGAFSGNSGLINYINRFGYSAGYKSYDPAGEMFYEVVRYFKNLTPSDQKYCNGLSEPNDNFAVYCNASKTNVRGWRDPTLYACSQNFVIAVNDANPWLDKRIPGSAFKASYGGNAVNDYCGSGALACDTDFADGGVQIDVEGWTNKVGDLEGLTGTTMSVACEVDAAGACIGGINTGGKNVTISKLGRIIGTPPGPGKENSYNIAGLAYYAHSTDLRPDLGTSDKKRNLTTYMIDTQEPAGSMLVGPRNMLYLAAKYGGFQDLDNDQGVTLGGVRYSAPFKSATCGGVNSTPSPLCNEWDADNDGYPDNYFFASAAAKVESGLYKAFASILNRATSGTAAAVANNRSGERGANIIQALFYPQWPKDMNIKWLGDVQALWFYLDPIVKFSGIYEDSDADRELNLAVDLPAGADALNIKALWKAGPLLHTQSAASRNIYTLLNSSVKDLTNGANALATANRAALKPLLDVSSYTDTQADLLINYIRGVDAGAYRSRTVTNGNASAVWKLGDIINSTPQIQGSDPINNYHLDYGDTSYRKFTLSSNYRSNNYVYTGSNDGMLHAFKLGLVQKVNDPTNVYRIASIVDATDIGKEAWAFIPANALPYLKNCADNNYCHQYLVDGTPLIFDASIKKYSACTSANYWECERKTTYSSGSILDASATSWRSVLLTGMGLGGASRDGNCNETLSPDTDPANNGDCIKTPVANAGFSSYFALDITDPLVPNFMWEFSDAVLPAADRGLGLTTPGAAVLRINSKSGTPPKPDRNTNGRWFALFASGPTGAIDAATKQFLGRSDQNLKLYIVDLNSAGGFSKCTTAGASGCNYWVIDTNIKFAFANSLVNAVIDLDKGSAEKDGVYSDDVVYITYTKASLDGSPSPGPYPTAWDRGGVLRLVTNNDPDPANWFISPLIDDIGPVNSSVDIIQNKNTKKLWVFFGEGRYFFKGDDLHTARRIFGVADPCYNFDLNHVNTLSTTAASCPTLDLASLKDQSSTPAEPLLATQKGWYITLDGESGVNGAERMTGGVTANPNGVVFYTTFVPSSDPCVAGGTPSQWAVNYSTGGTPPARSMIGKVILTTSDSPIARAVNIAGAFTQRGNRKLDQNISNNLKGMPPLQPPPNVTSPLPVKRIMNIQEH